MKRTSTSLHIKEALDRWRQDTLVAGPYREIMIANCLVRLGFFAEARSKYKSATNLFLADRNAWPLGLPISFLVDSFLLSGETELFDRVAAVIGAHQQGKLAAAPLQQYSFAVISFIRGSVSQTKQHVANLQTKSRFKLISMAGWAFEAIVERENARFQTHFNELLEIHGRSVKFGALRDTAEGYICLPAMALAVLALSSGMTVVSESEFYSGSYLQSIR